MKKVLLTGANGLLGANLLRELNAQGYSVRALLRKNCDKRSLDGCEFETFEGDISNPSDLENAVDGCDFVIHAAARTVQYPDDIEAYRSINVDVTQHLCEICLDKQVQRLLFISTANCFTNGTLNNPGNEDGKFMPWLETSGYAYSKYLAQKIVLNQVKENGLDAIILVPTFMIGAFDAKLSSGQLTLHGLKKTIVFHPSGGKSFVDVKAVAKATVNGLRMGEKGGIYMLSGQNMTYKSFFKLLSEISERKPFLIQIPSRAILFAGWLVGILKQFLPLKTPFNLTNAKLLSLGNYFSNHKAKDKLLMPDTNIREALKASVLWLKKHHLS